MNTELLQNSEIKKEFDDYFPATFTPQTKRVLLRPITAADLESFLPLTKDKIIWKYFSKDLSNEQELQNWIAEALDDRSKRKRIPFTIIDKLTGEVCGSTSYGNISAYDKRIEIGWSWLGVKFMSTGINRNAKFALLKYAFEVLQFERVEIVTDNLNERAKAALLKIGATPEGVLRSHKLMHSNRRRDSIYFSILKNEWENVKKEILCRL